MPWRAVPYRAPDVLSRDLEETLSELKGRGRAWHSMWEFALRRKADRIHRSLSAIVAQTKSYTLGVNSTIQLKNMTATSDSSGIWRGIFPLTNVPVLSHVVLIFFISIVVLTSHDSLPVVPILSSVSDVDRT